MPKEKDQIINDTREVSLPFSQTYQAYLYAEHKDMYTTRVTKQTGFMPYTAILNGYRTYLPVFYTVIGILACTAITQAQTRDIRIIEEQGQGVITLSAENKMASDCEVTIAIESTGLDLSKPTPLTARVPAGKTLHLVTLTPLPGQAWRYRYNTQYTQIVAPPQDEVPQDSPPTEIRPWDIPQTPTTTPPTRETDETVSPDADREPERVMVPEPVEHNSTPSGTEGDRTTTATTKRDPDVPVTERRESVRPPGQVNKNPGITLYSSPNCTQCDQARVYLSGLGVQFKEVDLSIPSRESAGMWEQLYEQGYGGTVQAPVIAQGISMYFDIQDVRELLRTLVYQ